MVLRWVGEGAGREPVLDWGRALGSWEDFRCLYPAFVVRGLLRAVRGVEPGFVVPEELPLEILVEDLIDEYLSRVDGDAPGEWFMLDPARLGRVRCVMGWDMGGDVDLGDAGSWRRFRGSVLHAVLDSVPWDVGDPDGGLTLVLLRDAELYTGWCVSPHDVLGLEGAPTPSIAPVVIEAARLLLRVGLGSWAGGLGSWHGAAMSMAPHANGQEAPVNRHHPRQHVNGYGESWERDWRSPSWLNGLVRSLPAGPSRTYVDAWRGLFRVLRRAGVYRRDHYGKWVQAGAHAAPPISEDDLAEMMVDWDVMLALADPVALSTRTGRDARLVSRVLGEALGRFAVDEGLLHRVKLSGLWRVVGSLIMDRGVAPERMSGAALYRRMRTLDALGWDACPSARTLEWLAARLAASGWRARTRVVDGCGVLLGTASGGPDSPSDCLARAMILKYVLESFPDHGGYRHGGNEVRDSLEWCLGYGYVLPVAGRYHAQLDGGTDQWRWEAIRAARTAYLRGSGTGPGAWLEDLPAHAAPTITSNPNGTRRTSTDPEAPWAVTIPDDTRPAE